jgi:uncharacterized protein involved in exopolysaccharide biosynthesis/Mrp family chromosome partitioning ATPase
MIAILTVLGIIAAVALYFLYPPTYQSEAKLLVRYVLDRSAVDPIDTTGATASSKSIDAIIGAEVEILTSWDLAVQVADAVGPKRLLPHSSTPPTKEQAAVVVASGLEVASHKGSNIIYVAYDNRDPELAPLVLNELLSRYFVKHLEVHRSAGAFDFVTQQIDRVRARLGQTEDALTPLKTKLGIVTLADSKKELSDELAKTHDKLHDAEAELAEQKARVQEIEGAQSGGRGAAGSPAPASSASPSSSSTKAATAGPTGASATPGVATAKPSAAPVRASEEDLQKYEALVARLQQLREAESKLVAKYAPQNELVQRNRAELNSVEREKLQMEQKSPDLPSRLPVTAGRNVGGGDLAAERAHLAGSEAKVAALKEQLSAVEDRMKQLSELGPQIAELERQKEVEESNYKYFANSLEKARVDEALDPSKIPNISAVQRPSPPSLLTNTRDKIALGLAVGGFVLGIGLALARELILTQKVKRPSQLEAQLHTPVLLSIPDLSGSNGAALVPSGNNGNGSTLTVKKRGGLAPWDPGHFIRKYSEAVRDRIGLYFELHNLTHKPKLVGVTSFTDGAGTSTLAAGLAAALSETDEGKVLLVDVNLGPGEVHPFFQGKPAYPLNTALEPSRPMDAAAENLYLAQVGNAQAGPAQLGLKKFFDLMPNLKASDFDYIIFDMPPLTSISQTWGMAAFMDKLLLVVEAGKSNKELIRRGYSKLMTERDNISVILNKTRSYVPKSLDNEI